LALIIGTYHTKVFSYTVEPPYPRIRYPRFQLSVVSVIRGLLQPENINTFTAKVDRGRFQYLRFNLSASTLVDLKFTLRFYIYGSLLSAVSGIRSRSWNVSPSDTGGTTLH
jgi:hypothetical protein